MKTTERENIFYITFVALYGVLPNKCGNLNQWKTNGRMESVKIAPNPSGLQ